MFKSPFAYLSAAVLFVGAFMAPPCGEKEEETTLHYAPVESKAGKVSPQRQRYITALDQTCAATFNYNQFRYRQVAKENPGDELALNRAKLAGNKRQYDAFVRLGPPPDGEELHAAWLANVARRHALWREYERLFKRGDQFEAGKIAARIDDLKIEGDEIGQQFGLRICTSNGPDRQPAR